MSGSEREGGAGSGDLPNPETAGMHPAGRFDAFIEERFAAEDELLRELRRDMESRGLPVIQVPAVTGRLLQVLVAATGARRVVEVGTLAGYSAIWMARALPSDGELVTLEKDAERGELARSYFERAGLEDRIEVQIGRARELMAGLGPDASRDLVFVDADKEGNREYAEAAARLLRPGGSLVVDNALWRGRVLDAGSEDAAARAVRDFDDWIASDERFLATVLTVGDGLLWAVRKGQ